jgi:hypothetical protein
VQFANSGLPTQFPHLRKTFQKDGDNVFLEREARKAIPAPLFGHVYPVVIMAGLQRHPQRRQF